MVDNVLFVKGSNGEYLMVGLFEKDFMCVFNVIVKE